MAPKKEISARFLTITIAKKVITPGSTRNLGKISKISYDYNKLFVNNKG